MKSDIKDREHIIMLFTMFLASLISNQDSHLHISSSSVIPIQVVHYWTTTYLPQTSSYFSNSNNDLNSTHLHHCPA